MTPKSFREKLTSLTQGMGESCSNLENGHARWAVYDQAIRAPREWLELLDLVGQEPDEMIASSVVVKIMEVVPGACRMDYVTVLPPGKARDYAVNRVHELAIIEKLSAGGAESDVESSPQNWSVWLQLRAENSASDELILEYLSENGATKRVRSAAQRRWRSLRSHSDPSSS